MKERPSWYKGTIEGKSDEVLSETDIYEQLSVARQFMIDSAPEGWEVKVDPTLLNEYRQDIMRMTDKELLVFMKRNDVWSEPSYAQAILDVIAGKITPVL